jgi:hypothetical protein
MTSSNQKIINYKVVDCIENYNFGVDHVNILVSFENSKIKFQILRN